MAFILTHKNRRWIARALSRFTVKRQAYKIRATVAFTRLLTSSLIRDRRFNGEMRDCCASISIQISDYNASYVLTSALGSIRRFLKHSTNPAVSSPRYLRLNDNISVEFAIRTFDEPNGVCLFQVFVFDSGLWSVKTPNIQYTDTTVYIYLPYTVQQVLQSTQILQVNCCQSLCCLMVKPRTVIAYTDQVEKQQRSRTINQHKYVVRTWKYQYRPILEAYLESFIGSYIERCSLYYSNCFPRSRSISQRFDEVAKPSHEWHNPEGNIEFDGQ